MSDHREAIYTHFRLNLEQQRKRAKEFLKAVKSSSAEALRRAAAYQAPSGKPPGELKLADAQFVIAKDLGFTNWADLKIHIESMDRERSAIMRPREPLDQDCKTLHLRCGSDIRSTLNDAGFKGDFLEHSNPYCQGPVTNGPDRLEQRARFIAGHYGGSKQLEYERVLEGLREDEQQLAHSVEGYARVVFWMEHDSYDQLVLLRCLAFYATSTPPRVLELISVDHFPGTTRFIGLGQLPAEALRLLWPRRQSVTNAQLQFAHATWQAFVSESPVALASIVRDGSPLLPHVAPALRRHLQELPSIENGLGLTEQLILQILAEGPRSINEIWHRLLQGLEPLPWLGDIMFLDIVDRMLQVDPPPFHRTASANGKRFGDRLEIGKTGRAVLQGRIDWLSLNPPERWVGGVRIPGSQANGPQIKDSKVGTQQVWRWNDRTSDAQRDGA